MGLGSEIRVCKNITDLDLEVNKALNPESRSTTLVYFLKIKRCS
jgi:hypothetical protein